MGIRWCEKSRAGPKRFKHSAAYTLEAPATISCATESEQNRGHGEQLPSGLAGETGGMVRADLRRCLACARRDPAGALDSVRAALAFFFLGRVRQASPRHHHAQQGRADGGTHGQLGGDLGLALAVHDQGEAALELSGVVRRVVHGVHAGSQLRGQSLLQPGKTWALASGGVSHDCRSGMRSATLEDLNGNAC